MERFIALCPRNSDEESWRKGTVPLVLTVNLWSNPADYKTFVEVSG